EAAIEPASRDGTHLVIELRPADALAAMAEPDELHGLTVGGPRVGDVSRATVSEVHRWPTLQSIPSRGSTNHPPIDRRDQPTRDAPWRCTGRGFCPSRRTLAGP